jgi:hypothetical protein
MASQVSERFLSSLKTYAGTYSIYCSYWLDGRYYNSDTLSDATVVCESEEFKVYRVILSSHSAYFAKELSGTWKV